MRLRQGGVYWAEADGKRRPVLIVTRHDVLGRLNRVVVAPVTRTVRNVPTEIPLGAADGLDVVGAATFDNLQLVRRSSIGAQLGMIDRPRAQICEALAALADC